MLFLLSRRFGVLTGLFTGELGWTGPACAALVMLSERAVEKMADTQETSFSMSLKKW